MKFLHFHFECTNIQRIHSWVWCLLLRWDEAGGQTILFKYPGLNTLGHTHTHTHQLKWYPNSSFPPFPLHQSFSYLDGSPPAFCISTLLLNRGRRCSATSWEGEDSPTKINLNNFSDTSPWSIYSFSPCVTSNTMSHPLGFNPQQPEITAIPGLWLYIFHFY